METMCVFHYVVSRIFVAFNRVSVIFNSMYIFFSCSCYVSTGFIITESMCSL